MASQSMVLVVDDEKICLMVAKKLIEHLEMKAICSQDGQEALELYEKNRDKIFCVLLDIQMPEMDGIEVFKCLKDLDEDVPVVIMSGFVNKKNRQQIEPLQPVAYIEKPLHIEDIERALQQVVHA